MAPRNRGGRRNDDDDDDGGESLLSDSQRTEITNLVNGAVSAHLQRKLPSIVQSAISGPISEIKALIEGRNAGASPAGAGDDEEDGGETQEPEVPRRGQGRQPAAGRRPASPSERTGRADPALTAMQRRVEAMEAERKVEREALRAKDRDGTLREHLTKLGVDPNRMRGAIAVLRENTKYDEKAAEWFYSRKVDGVEEELDLIAGASDWAATDEGKSYLAPQGAGNGRPAVRGGSGTRLAGTGGAPQLRGGAAPVADPKQAKAQAKAAAMQTLTGAINSLSGDGVAVG